MCLAPKTPKVPDPAPPVAPLATPAPMALAEAATTRRETGVSQLRIGGRKATPEMLGAGAARDAAITLRDRKKSLDEAIAASGG